MICPDICGGDGRPIVFLIFRNYDDVSSFLFSIIIIISKYNSLKIVEPNVK